MIRGTETTPSTVLKKTRKKMELTMMKMTAAVPSPNHVMASGIQGDTAHRVEEGGEGNHDGAQPPVEPGQDAQAHAEHDADRGGDPDPPEADQDVVLKFTPGGEVGERGG